MATVFHVHKQRSAVSYSSMSVDTYTCYIAAAESIPQSHLLTAALLTSDTISYTSKVLG